MTNFKTLALSALAVIGITVAANGAFAQTRSTASANANANAKIVAGIGLTKNTDLNFGQVVRSAALGTVVLDASTAGRTFSGGATQGQNGGNTAAQFSVAGEPSYTYTITLPTSSTITVSGGTATMTVNGFTNSAVSGTLGTLDNTGAQSFNVGATLNVAANQTTGQYSGSFPVTVTYQ